MTMEDDTATGSRGTHASASATQNEGNDVFLQDDDEELLSVTILGQRAVGGGAEGDSRKHLAAAFSARSSGLWYKRPTLETASMEELVSTISHFSQRSRTRKLSYVGSVDTVDVARLSRHGRRESHVITDSDDANSAQTVRLADANAPASAPSPGNNTNSSEVDNAAQGPQDQASERIGHVSFRWGPSEGDLEGLGRRISGGGVRSKGGAEEAGSGWNTSPFADVKEYGRSDSGASMGSMLAPERSSCPTVAAAQEIGVLRWAASDSLLEHTWCRTLLASTGYSLTRDCGNLDRDTRVPASSSQNAVSSASMNAVRMSAPSDGVGLSASSNIVGGGTQSANAAGSSLAGSSAVNTLSDSSDGVVGGSQAANALPAASRSATRNEVRASGNQGIGRSSMSMSRQGHSAGWVLAKQYLMKLAHELAGRRDGKVSVTRSLSSNAWKPAGWNTKPETTKDLLQLFERQIRWCSGTSEVISAYDPYLNENVMIKVYNKRLMNERMLQHLDIESKLAARLQHESLVTVRSVLDNNGAVLIVMELCSLGDILREIVVGKDTLSEQYTFNTILRPILHAVQYLHEQGVVHCDVTPQNVLLRGNGSVCLCDFSNAIDLTDDDPPAHQRVGSLDYMPPEMLLLATAEEIRSGLDISGRASTTLGPAVDIWQVGCLAFELLTGRPPFEFPDVAMTATAIMFGTIEVWPSGMSDRARHFISRCLHKDPKKRPTAKELLGSAAITANVPQTSLMAISKKGFMVKGLCRE